MCATRSIAARSGVARALQALWPAELQAPELLGLEPLGFLCRRTLDLLERQVRLGMRSAGETRLLLDLGCGRGRIGARLAESSRARLIGVDRDPQAIAKAALAHADAPERTFLRSSFARLPLRDGVVRVAVSLDALYLAQCRLAALDEVRRVLAVGGRLVFTGYTSRGAVPGGQDLPSDWRPLLRASGFKRVQAMEVTRPWRKLQRMKHSNRLLHQESLISEHGAAVCPDLSVSHSMLGLNGPSYLSHVRRWVYVGFK